MNVLELVGLVDCQSPNATSASLTVRYSYSSYFVASC